MCFVGFNIVPNLIVILFNLLYPVFIVGFDYKGCVIERECEDSSNWRLKSFHGYLATKHPVKWLMWLAHAEIRRVKTRWRQLCLANILAVSCEYPAGKAFSRDTREAFCFAKLSTLIHTFCVYTIYTHIIHKCYGVLLRENPSQPPWELEIVIPIILYTIAYGFSSTPTSPFSYHWEIDSPNTYHIFLEYQVRFWCCWKVLEEAKDDRCNTELGGIQRARQDTVSRNLVGLGAWRA